MNPLTHARASDPIDSNDEEWRVIPGYSRYSASTLGRVRRHERVYKTAPGFPAVSVNRGYARVAVTSDDGASKSRFVHQLVALAFLGPRPDGMHTRHLYGNAANNAPANLAYGTPTENVHDAISHGTQVRGSRQHLAKLTDDAVAQIKAAYVQGEQRISEIARQFSIRATTVLDIARGRTWTHVEPQGDLRLVRKATPPKAGWLGKQKTSRFTGVSLDKRTGRWIASLHNCGKRTQLGLFSTEEEAFARVLEAKADLQLLGKAQPTGDTRRTRTGRAERVWAAC